MSRAATSKTEERASGGLTEAIAQGHGDVRKKNQITLPKAIAGALGLQPGDRLLFLVKENEPGEAHLYRMPSSFAGTAPHAFGGTESSTAYVRTEREAWEE